MPVHCIKLMSGHVLLTERPLCNRHCYWLKIMLLGNSLPDADSRHAGLFCLV